MAMQRVIELQASLRAPKATAIELSNIKNGAYRHR